MNPSKSKNGLECSSRPTKQMFIPPGSLGRGRGLGLKSKYSNSTMEVNSNTPSMNTTKTLRNPIASQEQMQGMYCF